MKKLSKNKISTNKENIRNKYLKTNKNKMKMIKK
jgi:hypothetical protein